MVETTNDIKKQIQSTLKELREQKERYIKRIDVVMQEIKNIENSSKKLHEFDSMIKDVDAKTYYKVLMGVSILQVLLLLLSWIMVIRKREKRGLHEIFSNTEVVSLKKRR